MVRCDNPTHPKTVKTSHSVNNPERDFWHCAVCDTFCGWVDGGDRAFAAAPAARAQGRAPEATVVEVLHLLQDTRAELMELRRQTHLTLEHGRLLQRKTDEISKALGITPEPATTAEWIRGEAHKRTKLTENPPRSSQHEASDQYHREGPPALMD